MSNVHRLYEEIDALTCGECDNDSFFLAMKEGGLIAYCSNCHAPSIAPKCSCLIKKDSNESSE